MKEYYKSYIKEEKRIWSTPQLFIAIQNNGEVEVKGKNFDQNERVTISGAAGPS
ncbi:hypothetical protein [Francisella hispaniensis]|uniref:hypothetical protein n=1 Tax=Francisella hispaniensis TaxID=622488 RepID=UPI001902EE80|nr:hypothetical protein [Francisella hispaniensis]MBK2357682.1 hypothetical protein [Francisella hispaniensis]